MTSLVQMLKEGRSRASLARLKPVRTLFTYRLESLRSSRTAALEPPAPILFRSWQASAYGLGDIFAAGLPRTGKHCARLPLCLFGVPNGPYLSMHRFPEARLTRRMILYSKTRMAVMRPPQVRHSPTACRP